MKDVWVTVVKLRGNFSVVQHFIDTTKKENPVYGYCANVFIQALNFLIDIVLSNLTCASMIVLYLRSYLN